MSSTPPLTINGNVGQPGQILANQGSGLVFASDNNASSIQMSGDVEIASVNGTPWNFDGVPVSSADLQEVSTMFVPTYAVPALEYEQQNAWNGQHSDPYIKAMREYVGALEDQVISLTHAMQDLTMKLGSIYLNGDRRVRNLSGSTK